LKSRLENLEVDNDVLAHFDTDSIISTCKVDKERSLNASHPLLSIPLCLYPLLLGKKDSDPEKDTLRHNTWLSLLGTSRDIRNYISPLFTWIDEQKIKKKLEGFYAYEYDYDDVDSYVALYENSYQKFVKPYGTSDPAPLKSTWSVERAPRHRLSKLLVSFNGIEEIFGDYFGLKWMFGADVIHDTNDCFPSDVRVTQENFVMMLKVRKTRSFYRCGVGVAEVVGDACCHGAVSNLARELHARVPKSSTHYNRLTMELSKIVEKYANMCMLEAMTDDKIEKIMAEDFVQMIPELRDTFPTYDHGSTPQILI